MNGLFNSNSTTPKKGETISASNISTLSIIASVKQTVIEMMLDRGYTHPVEKLFKNVKGLTATAIHAWISSNEMEVCYIFFCMEPKLGVQEFRKFQNIMEEDDVHHCIIISNQGVTSFTSTMLQNIDRHELEVEFFPWKYLVRNPTRHYLYTPHRALSDKEKLFIMKSKYHAKKDQIPILCRDDRICQYFNFPVDTLVEITRCYGSVGPYKTYRIVQNI